VPGSYISSVGGAGAVLPGNGAYGGEQMGDFVGNLRIDQTWGGAQVMGALHEVNANYYTATTPASGHPSDQWGWAAGFGFKLNLPMISPGDRFQTQFNVARGALRYMANTEATTNFGDVKGAGEAYGVYSDCVFGGSIAGGNATGCQLTSAWSFNAAYEHFWTPAWHTSFYGAYLAVSYNSSANNMLCGIEGNGASFGSTAAAGAGCNNNWKVWGFGARTQWDVTKTFYLGADVTYQNLQSATFNTVGGLGTTAFGGAVTQVANRNNVAIDLRAHRDFLP
jgi:porin-like protein